VNTMSLNTKQQLILDVISRLISNKLTVTDAARLLDVTKRTIYRYKKSHEKNSVISVIHGNSLKIPHNKIPEEERVMIIKLCKDRYKNFNRLHAYEKLVELHQFSRSYKTFYNWCKKENILTKKSNKSRRKKVRNRRDRMKQTGLMIQMDGSPHRWFNRKKTCLIIAIDDANGEIIAGFFAPTETTFACMEVIKEVFRKKGVFKVLYTDKAGIFGGGNNNPFAVKRHNFSQLEERLDPFGINVIHANSPEAKGRVERAFNTLQDRLVVEMELARIFTIKAANEYFNNYFLPEIFNKKFTVEPMIKESAFTSVITTNIDDKFYTKVTRTVKNDHTVSYGGRIWDIESIDESIADKEIELRFYPNGSSKIFWKEKEIYLKGTSLLKVA